MTNNSWFWMSCEKKNNHFLCQFIRFDWICAKSCSISFDWKKKNTSDEVKMIELTISVWDEEKLVFVALPASFCEMYLL